MKYCNFLRHSNGNSRHNGKVHYDRKNPPQVFRLDGGAKYVHLRISGSPARLLLDSAVLRNRIERARHSL